MYTHTHMVYIYELAKKKCIIIYILYNNKCTRVRPMMQVAAFCYAYAKVLLFCFFTKVFNYYQASFIVVYRLNGAASLCELEWVLSVYYYYILFLGTLLSKSFRFRSRLILLVFYDKWYVIIFYECYRYTHCRLLYTIHILHIIL
jgi:hypothetical protein